uniref:hypothetical protein n=1 Tax=uncultured Prevotella sp. TaxID=159272 RepID=UPI0027E32ED4
MLLKAKIVEHVVFNVLTHSLYGLKITKRPARAKALVINAFALAGRFVIGGLFPQGAALGYVLLPYWVGCSKFRYKSDIKSARIQ